MLYGNALAEGVLARAQLDSRAGCIAATGNEEVNFLFAGTRRRTSTPRVWIALRSDSQTVQKEMLELLDARLLFGAPRTLDLWSLRLDKGEAVVEAWVAGEAVDLAAPDSPEPKAWPFRSDIVAAIQHVSSTTAARSRPAT